jgi:hypothetical protein
MAKIVEQRLYIDTHAFKSWGVRRDRMVVGFITTYAMSTYHHYSFEFEPRSGEVYSIQHFMNKFVSYLRQADGFLLVLWLLPPIKLTTTI